MESRLISTPGPQPVTNEQLVDVSIIIVTWNSAAWIERCLESIATACGELQFEVIVHDNASADDSVGAARRAAPGGFTIESSPSNEGFAGGVNSALERAAGRYVMLLNPDCILTPLSVERLCRFLDQRADASAAVPLLTSPDGDLQTRFQFRRLPGVWALVTDVLSIDRLLPSNRVTARYRYADLELTSPVEIEQPAAAAIVFRRAVFEEIGSFDRRFTPAWFEDVDFARRMADAGLRTYALPEVRVIHAGGSSVTQLQWDSFVEIWYTNMYRYARKWFSKRDVAILRWVMIFGMVLRSTAIAARVWTPRSGKRRAIAAHIRVLKLAFKRWDNASHSS
jgi:O-antigen biosynthesis protein